MAFEKLKASPCFNGMKDRLEAGNSPEKVAEWAQDTEKCWAGVKRDSLVRSMYRFKKAEIPVTVAQVIASAPGGNLSGPPSLRVWDRIQGMQRGLNEIEQLENLYLLQLTRIHRGVTIEEQINFTNFHNRKDIEAAAELLEKMADIKLRLGIYKEADKNLNLNVNGRLETESTQALDNLEPEARRTLGKIAAGVLDTLLKKQAQPAPELIPSVASPSSDGDDVAEAELVEDDDSGQ